MKPKRVPIEREAYETSAAHLRDELARADVLVRAQVVRWRRTIGAAKPADLWGMVHVSEAEIEQYLATEPAPPGRLPESLVEALRPYWEVEAEAAADIRLAVEKTPRNLELRVERLRSRFGLDEAELDTLLLMLLPELDHRYRRIYGYLQDDASRSTLPPDLIGEIVHPKAPTLEEKRALLEPSGRLRRWSLLDVTERAVRIDPRIASFLVGCEGFAAELSDVLAPVATDLTFEDLDADAETIVALRAFAARGIERMVVLQGPEGSGRLRAARAICRERGVGLLCFDADALAREGVDRNRLLAAAWREALLRNAAVFADAGRLDPAVLEALLRAEPDAPVLTFVARETVGETPLESRVLRFRFDVPHVDARRPIWLKVLPDIADRSDVATRLAAAFQLTGGQIAETVRGAEMLARRRSIAEPRVTADDLFEAARGQSGRRLRGFARRIEPTRGLTLDDVVLNRANKKQLRELRDRIRLRSRMAERTDVTRGQGLVVLFAGPSGTGKTHAAEAIASEQGVDLFKVDASAVVSKWVGETEKNLSRVFADAEGSDALLFFDECDSLFGHRGEINDAQDRWGNQQINYLLQRVEEYPGVIILATNLRSNIDDAFLRRIRTIVEFPLPDAPLRLALWKRSTAGWQGLRDGDLAQLAERFTLTGASIRDVAIDSMFRAIAKERDGLALRDVIAAIGREYQKLGRPMTRGEFGEEFYVWVVEDVIAPPADEP